MSDKNMRFKLVVGLALSLLAVSTRLNADGLSSLKAARDCAAVLLAPMALQTGVDLSNELAASQWLHVHKSAIELPIEVYSAELVTRRPGYVVTFATEGKCTLLGGDVSDVLGVMMTTDEVFGLTIVQYNEAVRDAGVKYDTPLSTVLALLQLAPQAVSIRVLSTIDDIPRRPRKGISRDERRVLAIAREQIKPPEIDRGSGDVAVVRFFTWDELGGIVSNNTATLLADGRVSLSRTTVASHVGAFKQVIVRM